MCVPQPLPRLAPGPSQIAYYAPCVSIQPRPAKGPPFSFAAALLLLCCSNVYRVSGCACTPLSRHFVTLLKDLHSMLLSRVAVPATTSPSLLAPSLLQQASSGRSTALLVYEFHTRYSDPPLAVVQARWDINIFSANKK